MMRQHRDVANYCPAQLYVRQAARSFLHRDVPLQEQEPVINKAGEWVFVCVSAGGIHQLGTRAQAEGTEAAGGSGVFPRHFAVNNPKFKLLL